MIKTLKEYIESVEGSKVGEEWFKYGAFEAFKRPAREPYEIADQAGTIDTLEGSVRYPAGYYIMTGPKGERYPISPERFKEIKVDNGDGTASPKPIRKLAKVADHSGTVDTSWGEKLQYNPEVDVIVRHGPGDYGVVKADIFKQTYERV
jgi:hypothetical protein